MPSLPAANVGVATLAAGFAIGAKGHDIDLAFEAGVQVLIGPAPRVVGQLVQIGAPIERDRVDAWLLKQMANRDDQTIVERIAFARAGQPNAL